MKLLVVCVLLSVAQALTPIPRLTADEAKSYPEHAKKNHRANKKAPATLPSPKPQTAQPLPKQNTADNKDAPNAKQPITVSELPSVSVTKDWMDRSAWAFSLLLAVVGIAGVGAALLTLRGLREQAGLMQSQLAAMKGQLKVMESQLALAARQWIDITRWTASLQEREDRTGEVTIAFDIVNPTKLPLTLEMVETISRANPLPLRSGFLSYPIVPTVYTRLLV